MTTTPKQPNPPARPGVTIVSNSDPRLAGWGMGKPAPKPLSPKMPDVGKETK